MTLEEQRNLSQYSDEELFSKYDNSEFNSEKITAPRYSYWKSVFRVFFRKKSNFVILGLLLLIILAAFVYPAIFKYDPQINIMVSGSRNLSPTAAINKFGFSISWILGTGKSGESIFDAIWFGSRISLSLAFICAAINMSIGVIIGAVWGFSKKVDIVMMEVFNIVGNVPYILLISVLSLLLGAGFWTFVFALTVTGWLSIAYFIRTQVIIIRDREYNLASRCLGTPILRLTLKNILPFLTSVIVTLLATELPLYISYEVYLSYLGMGLNEETLGKLIERYQVSMLLKGQELQFWAPVAISSIITIVLYVVGQNLGDASDPRTHM